MRDKGFLLKILETTEEIDEEENSMGESEVQELNKKILLTMEMKDL